MTLLFRRRQICRAVEGELSAAQETRLRQHLSSCDPCREYYDEQVTARRLVRGKLEATAVETQRDFRAVLERLKAPAAPSPRRNPLTFVAAATVAFIVCLVGLVSLSSEHVEVQFRGASNQTDSALTLRVYASSAASEPVRLAGEFPGSGEVTLAANEWVFFKFVPQKNEVLKIRALDEQGSVQEWPIEKATRILPGRYRLLGPLGPNIGDSAFETVLVVLP